MDVKFYPGDISMKKLLLSFVALGALMCAVTPAQAQHHRHRHHHHHHHPR
jgi:hypothetical protein